VKLFVPLLIVALLLLLWTMFDPADPGPFTDPGPSPQDQLQIEENTGVDDSADRSAHTSSAGSTTSQSKRGVEVAPWYISGRVVDEDGNPAIFASASLDLDFQPLVECDSDGLFMMEVEAGFVGDLFIHCDNDRRLQEELPSLVGQVVTDVRADAEDPRRFIVTLTEGLHIDGIVIDAEERPVSGAAVFSGATRRISTGFIVMGTSSAEDDRIWPETISRTDGTFTLAGIPVRDYRLWASRLNHAESEPVNVTPGTPEVILQLRNQCILRGVVVDERGAPQDVPVKLFRGLDVEESNHAARRGEGSLLAEENANNPEVGHFELYTGTVGMHQLVVDSSKYVKASRLIDLKPGVNDVGELVLKSPALLHGRVVDQRGVAVSGAVFSGNGSSQQGFIAISEDDGTFELRVDPSQPQDRMMTISHHDHPDTRLDVSGYTVGDQYLGDVVLKEGLTIRGVVLSPDTAPVKGARVNLRQLALPGAEEEDQGFTFTFGGANGLVMEAASDSDTVQSATTDAGGEFSIVVENRGDYEIDAEATGYGSSATVPLSVLGSIEGVRLDLATVFVIEGRVIDDLGVLVGGVRLTARKAVPPENQFRAMLSGGGAGDGIRTTSAQDGYFRFEVSEEIPYRITVTKGQHWNSLENPTVDAGNLNAQVVVTEGGRIEGTVVDSITLQPITSFQLDPGALSTGNFFFFGEGTSGVEYTHPDGFFDIIGLEGGSHRITIEAEGYVKETAEVDVELGATTSITISLQPGAAIAGRIVDATGEPMEGVRVSVSRPGEEPEPQHQSSINISFSTGSGGVIELGNSGIRTDEKGNFLVDGIEAGDWQVRATKSGHETQAFEVRGTTPGIITDSGTHTLYPEVPADH